MTSEPSIEYISASTNRFHQAADSPHEPLVALGSKTLVCLWNTDELGDRGIFETLPGHEGVVTCIRFSQSETFFSADDKGNLLSWKRQRSKWNCVQRIKAHNSSISSLAVNGDRIVTGSSEGQVKLWKQVSENLTEIQTISLQQKFPLSLALSTLPNSEGPYTGLAHILAIGSTGWSIQIWTRSDNLLVYCATLSGHEDWVRSLAFLQPKSQADPLVLASGSQDGTIRLWNIEPFVKLVPNAAGSQDLLSDDLLDAFEASIGDLADAEEGGRQISLKQHILTVASDAGNSKKFSITFDALLVGHEAGVTSLSWRPYIADSSVPTLLSTSTDSSVILWSPSSMSSSNSASIWINRQRFGDVGGQRFGGFLGGLWANRGNDAMAWGWNGSWRRWHCNGGGEETWVEVAGIGGHNGPVKGINWSPGGEFLISAGLDQTARIHGSIRDHGTDIWHELGRPQVHGYDVLDCAFLDALRFVSISDEKVARVFEAPRAFITLTQALGVSITAVDERERPLTASVPPLGLSNKASTSTDLEAPASSLSNIPTRRPFEAELAATTLWPEVEKIFGHGYESISLAVSNSRTIIATSCKATSPQHAVIRLYDTEKWQPIYEPLSGHSLTVTRIAFSPDDRLILSVSRDRSWRLYELQENLGYVPVASNNSHARIIWDCSWAAEGDIFATASRDKCVKVWRRDDPASCSKWSAVATIKAAAASTTVSFSPADRDQNRRMAVGLETGSILVYSSLCTKPSEWHLVMKFDARLAHAGHVNRLAWRPGDHSSQRHLASCSEDGMLKVFAIGQ